MTFAETALETINVSKNENENDNDEEQPDT